MKSKFIFNSNIRLIAYLIFLFSFFSCKSNVSTKLYETRNSGVFDITNVYIDDSEITIDMRARFWPKMPSVVPFEHFIIGKTAFLEDEDGTRCSIISANGITLGDTITMPDSCIVNFKLTFENSKKASGSFTFNDTVSGLVFTGIQQTPVVREPIQHEDVICQILDNLNQIKYVSYVSTAKTYYPNYEELIEMSNPSVTAVEEFWEEDEPYCGLRYVIYNIDEKGNKIFELADDGKEAYRQVYKEPAGILERRDYSTYTRPFRMMNNIFHLAKKHLEYLLTTHDAFSMNFQENDSIYIISYRTGLFDSSVYFEGKPMAFYMKGYDDNPYCNYEITFDKKTMLPIRLFEYWTVSKVEFNVSDVCINNNDNKRFNIYEFLPKGWTLFEKKNNEVNLIGKKAPDWILTDSNDNEVKLNDYFGKTILLSFTGIGCGPCAESIKYLNLVKTKSDMSKFDVVAIECWQRENKVAQLYINDHDIKYDFLKADDAVMDKYGMTGAVPRFFVIDKNGIVVALYEGWDNSVRNELEKYFNVIE